MKELSSNSFVTDSWISIHEDNLKTNRVPVFMAVLACGVVRHMNKATSNTNGSGRQNRRRLDRN